VNVMQQNNQITGAVEQDLRTIEHALEGANPDQERIARVGLDWLATLLAKNSDYGSSVWKPPCLKPSMDAGDAILVRMSDKVSRIATLATKDAVVDESLEDTVKDLGAYAILWLARPKPDAQTSQQEPTNP